MTDAAHIVEFLQAMGEREMAEEVTLMHNRLEAFAAGLDKDAFDGMKRAAEAAFAQSDELLTLISVIVPALEIRSTGERYLGSTEHDAVQKLKSIANSKVGAA